MGLSSRDDFPEPEEGERFRCRSDDPRLLPCQLSPACARVAARRKDKFRSMDMGRCVLGLVAAYLWWWTREERLAEL